MVFSIELVRIRAVGYGLAGYLDFGYRLAIWSAGYLAGQGFQFYASFCSKLYENLFNDTSLFTIPNIPG